MNKKDVIYVDATKVKDELVKAWDVKTNPLHIIVMKNEEETKEEPTKPVEEDKRINMNWNGDINEL